MKLSISKSVILILMFLCTYVRARHNLTYSDLEEEGVACPTRDRCKDYVRSNQEYMDSSCECDFPCTYYKDCCIDAPQHSAARTPPRNSMKCINYGEDRHSGFYAISSCSPRWNGPREVRNKCTGPIDFSDPLVAAPVTNVAQKMTYRNLFCAECNNANMASLKNFKIRISCDGLQKQLTDEQILADIEYNQGLQSWGVNRLNSFGNATVFYGCGIIYDVPSSLNASVRFCRSNIISRCAANWTRPAVKKKCDSYMAVVYDKNKNAYRNPHCAICNHRTAEDISCLTRIHSRKRPMSFVLLLDVNQSDGDQVGMKKVATPECPSDQIYDPLFKKCRRLVCALPGHVVVDGRCVRG